MKLHDIDRLKKNFIHNMIRMECVILSMILIWGIFALEIPRDVVHASDANTRQMEYTSLQSRNSRVQADTREISGQQARLSGTITSGRQVREENLRTLVFVFLLLTGFVLLTLKQVSVKCYHLHSHGKVSIVRFIHLQDGQK